MCFYLRRVYCENAYTTEYGIGNRYTDWILVLYVYERRNIEAPAGHVKLNLLKIFPGQFSQKFPIRFYSRGMMLRPGEEAVGDFEPGQLPG